MTPPERTADERRRALDRAQEVRRERASIRTALKSGSLDPMAALDDVRCAGARVRWFLESLPGVGAARAETLMRDLAIAPTRRLAGLSDRQRAGLTAHLRADAR